VCIIFVDDVVANGRIKYIFCETLFSISGEELVVLGEDIISWTLLNASN